jgi:hypothetical protein
MQHSEQLIEELLAFQKALLAEGIVPIGTEWYTILPYDAQVLLALLNTTPRYTRDLPGDAEQYGFDMDQALATLRDLRILAESDVISLNIKIDPIEPVCNSFRVVLHSLGLA